MSRKATAGKTIGAWLLLGALCAPVSAGAETRADMGIIEARLNGTTKIWHVFSGGDVPGATWMRQDGGQHEAVIAGFEASGQGGTPPGSKGSQMTISFQFSPDATDTVHEISGSKDPGASMRLLPSADDISVLHNVTEGRVVVTAIEPSPSGTYRFSGTFHGTLTGPDEEVVGELTEGTFEVDGATLVEPAVPPAEG